MAENTRETDDVERFLSEKIDTVPHLEALLLIWSTRPRMWLADDLAARLYVSSKAAQRILQDLVRQDLLSMVGEASGQYYYQPSSEEKDRLMDAVNSTYRQEMVRISTMIHSKAPSAVREFARAFRFTKEQD